MKPLGHLFIMAALDLSRAADDASRRPRRDADDLDPPMSREEIARAWRRWGEADPTQPATGRRGLTLPAPRPGG